MVLLMEQKQEEEFQEAEILWPDAAQDLELAHMYYSLVVGDDDDDGKYSMEQRPTKPRGRQKASSPIDIPGRKVNAAGAKGPKASVGFSKFGQSFAGAGGGSFVIGSHVFVPPHVIIDHRRAKRYKAMMTPAVPKGRASEMVMLE